MAGKGVMHGALQRGIGTGVLGCGWAVPALQLTFAGWTPAATAAAVGAAVLAGCSFLGAAACCCCCCCCCGCAGALA